MRAARARCYYANFIHRHLLFNFEKNISYVFLALFLRNLKISFPSVFTVYFFLFKREKRRKNLTINLNKFCLHAVAGFATDIARIAMAHCSREAMFEVVQRHYNKIYQVNFLLCYLKYIPF